MKNQSSNTKAQRARIRKLRKKLMLPDKDPPSDRDLDAKEGFLRYLATIDEEPTSTHARQLIADGIELPHPDSFTESSVHDKLGQVICGLARHRCLLESTNHLSDLELYRRLWEETLNEPTYELDDAMGDCACHIDFVSSGSEEATHAYLKFYATEEDRDHWLRQFPEYEMPDHADPPFDRDQNLPQREDLSPSRGY